MDNYLSLISLKLFYNFEETSSFYFEDLFVNEKLFKKSLLFLYI